MKSKLPLLAALIAMFPVSGNGFTLDAVGYKGAPVLGNPASINVAGYGEVIFEAAEGEAIMVNSAYLNDTLPPNPDVAFEMKEAVSISLNRRESPHVDLVLAGISGPESPAQTVNSLRQPIEDTAGENGQEPHRVPETTSALLGLLGTALLLLRRLR
ncbi:MAG: hypothetical protein V4640_03430 [Verrucomicrobiota bacterium]